MKHIAGDDVLRIAEFFRQNTGDMTPVLAMASLFTPGRPLRYTASLMPQLPQDLPWDDEDRRPDGFSAIDEDTLEFTYTERFWERRKHTFVWDFTFPNSLTKDGAIDFCSPDRGVRVYDYSGEDETPMPPPEQVTVVVWKVHEGEHFLYEVASVYDGFPFRLEHYHISLDEWAHAHWANPRVFTSHPFEITELIQKVIAAGGEVVRKKCRAESMQGTAHLHKYLSRSPDLFYHPNLDLREYLAHVLDGGPEPKNDLWDDEEPTPYPPDESDSLFEGL